MLSSRCNTKTGNVGILYLSRPIGTVAGSSVIQDTDGTNSPAQNWNNNRVIINGKP